MLKLADLFFGGLQLLSERLLAVFVLLNHLLKTEYLLHDMRREFFVDSRGHLWNGTYLAFIGDGIFTAVDALEEFGELLGLFAFSNLNFFNLSDLFWSILLFLVFNFIFVFHLLGNSCMEGSNLGINLLHPSHD